MDEQYGKLYLADLSRVVVDEARKLLPPGADAIHLPDFPFHGTQIIAFMHDARKRGYNGHPFRFIPAGLRLCNGLDKHAAFRRAHCLRSESFEDRKTLVDQWVMWAPVPMRNTDEDVRPDGSSIPTQTDIGFGEGMVSALSDLALKLEVPAKHCRLGTLTELVYLALIENRRTGWPHGTDLTFVSSQVFMGERLGIRVMTVGGNLKLEIERWSQGESAPYTIAPVISSLG